MVREKKNWILFPALRLSVVEHANSFSPGIKKQFSIFIQFFAQNDLLVLNVNIDKW